MSAWNAELLPKQARKSEVGGQRESPRGGEAAACTGCRLRGIRYRCVMADELLNDTPAAVRWDVRNLCDHIRYSPFKPGCFEIENGFHICRLPAQFGEIDELTLNLWFWHPTLNLYEVNAIISALLQLSVEAIGGAANGTAQTGRGGGGGGVATIISNKITQASFYGCLEGNADSVLPPICDQIIAPSCPATLKSLDLGGNALTDVHAGWIARVLAHNRTLTDLDLHCNDIGPDGVRSLLQAVLTRTRTEATTAADRQEQEEYSTRSTGCCKLEWLILDSNRLGVEGCRVIGDFLKDEQLLARLKKLTINSNDIGSEGAKLIADGLSSSSRGSISSNNRPSNDRNYLFALEMSCNQIGDAGCIAMASALKRNDSLAGLDISRNEITTVGATSLLDALRHCNSTLQRLSISDNNDIERECRDNLDRQVHLSNERQRDAFAAIGNNSTNKPPASLWPHVLEFFGSKPDYVYRLLKSFGTDIFAVPTASLQQPNDSSSRCRCCTIS